MSPATVWIRVEPAEQTADAARPALRALRHDRSDHWHRGSRARAMITPSQHRDERRRLSRTKETGSAEQQ
eukprot:gene17-1007_t